MRIILLCISFVVLGCSNKTETKESNSNEAFKMYEASEMAALMEQIYVENALLKERILKKDTLGKFPAYFHKIESATFTKGKERNEFFNTNAQIFVKLQQEIYTANDAKKAFNAMVNQCIACHEVTCGGPIMRIKKLYIK